MDQRMTDRRWMNRLAKLAVAAMGIGSIIMMPPIASAADWTQWRGGAGDNHAAADVRVPIRWNFQTGENIVWKTPIPGRGHSTPVLAGPFIFLTTADQDAGTQSLIKLDRSSGRIEQTMVVHRGTLPRADS